MLIALMLAAACSGDCKVQKQFDQMEAALVEAPVTGTIHAHAEASTSIRSRIDPMTAQP